MNFISYLIAGAAVGYVVSLLLKTNSQKRPVLDILVGMMGASLAGYLIGPPPGMATINEAITTPALMVSALGAVLVLAIYRLLAARLA